MAQPKTIGAEEIHAAIERLAAAIVEHHRPPTSILFLGIANGGIELAKRLTARVVKLAPAVSAKIGTLDISFHRDDFGRNPIPKEFAATHIPADVNGAHIILVDDVLFSGRTIKAALDELFDHGRPTKVELAILADRGGRRLPFAPDYCGLVVPATESQKVVVNLDAKDSRHDQIRVEASVSRTSAL